MTERGILMKKAAGFLLLAGAAILSLLVGVEKITFIDLFQPDSLQATVLLSVRLPRTVSLVLAGASLSISGLVMQQLTQNKFVSPTTAGTMDSARLGILVSLLFFDGTSVIGQTVLAFLFAIAGTMTFTSILNALKLKNSVMVPLIGMMFGSIVGSLATFLAYQHDLIQNVSSWLQGNFSLISSENYSLIWISLPVLILVYLFAQRFAVMGMGEEIAVGLGISYKAMQVSAILLVALASSAVILTVGNIPFVGVVIPNIVAMRKGDHFKKIVFPTALTGALFLLICDVIGRIVIAPYEMPVSLIAGTIGSMLFLFLLFRGER